MSQFVPISPETLAEIIREGQALDPPALMRIPPEYHSSILPIRIVFWQRLRMLHQLMKKHAPQARNCLDFGGGGGVFSPTLAGSFPEVTLLDLNAGEAAVVKDRYKLNNLELVQQDATQCDLGSGRFDLVVAADVLEHFRDVDTALTPIREWMAPGGVLVTSLPTETFTYEMLRLVFRTKKPEDHYHTAAEVEGMIERQGFERIERRYAPLPLPLFPLFYISAWRKVER